MKSRASSRRTLKVKEALPYGGARVDALVEKALDLTPAERREVIDTLLFFETVMALRSSESKEST